MQQPRKPVRKKKPDKKPDNISRRDAITKILKLGASVSLPVAGGVGLAVYGRRREIRRLIQERTREFQKFGVANPETWARIHGMRIYMDGEYALNLKRNHPHRMAVDSINAISGVTGVPVERVLLTLELNKLDPYQIDALQNKILATKNDQEIKRLQNIQRIIGDFLRLPLQTKDTIKRFLETPNSLAKLRKEFGLK